MSTESETQLFPKAAKKAAPPPVMKVADEPAPPPPTQKAPTQEQIEKEHDAELDAAEEKRERAEADTPKGIERQIKAKEARLSQVVADFHRREDETMVEWLKNIQGSGPIQIRIHRMKPQTFKGKNAKGHLETIDETIDEDELRDRWGGGQYQLRVMRKGATGSWVFLTSTTIDIAGDPRIDNMPGALVDGVTSSQPQQPSVSPTETRALDIMEKQVDRMMSASSQRPAGPDMAMLAALMEPLKIQITQLTTALNNKDEQIKELANKPQNPFQEKLLDKMIEGDSARVNAVRSALESEIRTVKENALAQENRLRDQFDREKESQRRDHKDQMDRLVDNHKREIDALTRMQETVNVATKGSQDVTTRQLEGEIKRLERDNAELRTELKELRAKKDQTLLEKAKEMQDLKEALGVDEDNDAEKSTLERITDTVMNSDKLFDFAGKWLGPKDGSGGQPQQQVAAGSQQQAMQAQPRFMRRKEDGQVFARNPQGKWVPVRKRRAPDGSETGEMELGLEISPEKVAFAKTVLENAFAANKKPEAVAATISTALPPEIFEAIRTHGVDGFLSKVANLEPGSPLRRQDGINWLRKLGKALLGEVDSRGQVEETPSE